MTKKFNTIISILMTLAVVLVIGATASYAATVKNGSGYVNSSTGVNVRSSASTTSDIIRTLDDNTKITIKKVVFKSKTSTASKYKWYQVSVDGRTGYIRSDNVDGLKYKAVDAKVTSGVTYRKGAGTQMAKVGTLKKGTKVKVLLKATPVSSTKGSSSTWYMIKYNDKKYYASSTYFKLLDTDNSDDDKDDSDKDPVVDPVEPPKENKFEKMTDEEFENYLTEQGFTGSYVTKLKTLHKKHPNWVFKSVKTGLKWSDVVDEEHKNGVSLIHSSFSASYRDIGSMSMSTSNYGIYKKANSSSEKLGTLVSGAKFKLKKEMWYSSTPWLYIETESGIKGYVHARAFSGEYNTTFAGVVNDDDVNIRTGAGTSYDSPSSKKKGAKITVVLLAKDKNGDTWYKFKHADGYAYIKADYVDFESETAAKDLAKVTATAKAGAFKSKEPGWYNAEKTVVAYYLDPRNFLTEDRICMFENLKFDEEVHTKSVVDMVLTKTLKDNGFTADIFIEAGKKYDVNPVFLASRAVQETGGGSDCINGSKVDGTKVYNPFNIGAGSGSNPVRNALQYAYNQGWTTKAKAVNGGADFLADGYISNNQNSIYLQKFNVANGEKGLASHHQYMTNITAAYTESYIVKKSYSEFGILDEALTFIIPIYDSMPSSTKLP